MTHQQLSGAFQWYFESVKDHIRVKMICTRLLQRMQQAAVWKTFNRWDGTTFDDMRKKHVFEHAIRLWRRATLSKA